MPVFIIVITDGTSDKLFLDLLLDPFVDIAFVDKESNLRVLRKFVSLRIIAQQECDDLLEGNMRVSEWAAKFLRLVRSRSNVLACINLLYNINEPESGLGNFQENIRNIIRVKREAGHIAVTIQEQQ